MFYLNVTEWIFINHRIIKVILLIFRGEYLSRITLIILWYLNRIKREYFLNITVKSKVLFFIYKTIEQREE